MGSRKTEENVEFGKKVKKLREERDLTQAELGIRIGFTKNYVSDLERGLHKISAKTLMDLCEALRTTPYELMDCEVSDVEKRLHALIQDMTEEQRKGLLSLLSDR